MSLLRFFTWLEETSGSTAIRESILTYPIIETTHVLTLCLSVGMIALLDLRLLGLTLPQVPVSQVVGRLLPWALPGFVLSVITGVLLFYSSPVRISQNIFFKVKLVMLVLAAVNALAFHKRVYRRVAEWDLDIATPTAARVAGAVSLVLWIGIVTAGRMIAYNWFD